jgi:hypothetical protein
MLRLLASPESRPAQCAAEIEQEIDSDEERGFTNQEKGDIQGSPSHVGMEEDMKFLLHC